MLLESVNDERDELVDFSTLEPHRYTTVTLRVTE